MSNDYVALVSRIRFNLISWFINFKLFNNKPVNTLYCLQVDMPVFFYIDPSYCEDPQLEFIDEITLSYTFFQASPSLNLIPPSYAVPH